MRLGENSFGVPFSHQHFSSPPTHSSSIWPIRFWDSSREISKSSFFTNHGSRDGRQCWPHTFFLGCFCRQSYFFLLPPLLISGFIKLPKNSETVWITTPPVSLGWFIKGPKSLISPVRRWVALQWVAASRIGRSFSGRGTGQLRPDLEGTFIIAEINVSNLCR